MRVLVVMDQDVLAEAVRLALHHGTPLTRLARYSAEASRLLQEWQPHLMVVDMDLEGGLILEQLRERPGSSPRVPFIALTRNGDLTRRLLAFEEGADDILSLPFSTEELVARVLVILRRTYGGLAVLTPVIRLGHLEIDILNRRVRIGDSHVHLTPLEQSLLYLLAANAGRVVTREEIMDSLWSVDYVADSNVVDQHVRNLRVKLQTGRRAPQFITTVPGRGTASFLRKLRSSNQRRASQCRPHHAETLTNLRRTTGTRRSSIRRLCVV